MSPTATSPRFARGNLYRESFPDRTRCSVNAAVLSARELTLDPLPSVIRNRLTDLYNG